MPVLLSYCWWFSNPQKIIPGIIKPCKSWDIPPTSTAFFRGFLNHQQYGACFPDQSPPNPADQCEQLERVNYTPSSQKNQFRRTTKGWDLSKSPQKIGTGTRLSKQTYIYIHIFWEVHAFFSFFWCLCSTCIQVCFIYTYVHILYLHNIHAHSNQV